MKNIRFVAVILAMIATVGGCDTSDERAVKLATESADRQAQQNEVVADLGRKMSDNQRRIVEAVTNSRSELVSLQKEVADQRRELDSERKSLVAERRSESFLAAVLGPAGWIILAALPLVICWLVLSELRVLRSEDDATCQLLLDEFMPSETARLAAGDASYRSLSHGPQADSEHSDTEHPF